MPDGTSCLTTQEIRSFQNEDEFCTSTGSHMPGVNFINTLRAAFLYKSALLSFSLITVWIRIFCQNNSVAKTARKILMKLTSVLLSKQNATTVFTESLNSLVSILSDFLRIALFENEF